jgi:antitoxin component YwqK of YwqJK toxin-antitoxin module
MRQTLTVLVILMIGPLGVAAATEPLTCPDAAELGVIEGENGKIEFCTIADERLHGPARQWYPNGRQRTQDNWLYGKQEGTWIVWDENGQMREKRHFSGGLKTGAETYWFANGQVKTITCWKAGKREGPVAEWTRDGVPVVRGQHRQDLMDGDWFFRRPEDGLTIRVKYDRGNDGEPNQAKFPALEPDRLGELCG